MEKETSGRRRKTKAIPSSGRGLVAHAEPGTTSHASRCRPPTWTDQYNDQSVVTRPRQVAQKAMRRTIPRPPLIGLNCDLVAQGGGEFCWISSQYYRVLEAAGARVVLLPPTAGRPWCDGLDGLVMVGGLDLDARQDGFYLHASHRLMHAAREAFDRQLVLDAQSRRLPLLAIGVGMQTLNVVLGGTLAYHLPEDFPKSVAHQQADDPYHGHAVYCREGSLCATIYSDLVGYVRSQHHQAVDDVCAGFVATAWAEGGVVEAMESVAPDWSALGVQWHPEFATATETDRLIFDRFVHIAAFERE